MLNGAAGMIDTPEAPRFASERQVPPTVFHSGSGPSRIRSLDTGPWSGLGEMFVRQRDSDPDDDAHEKTDDETKTGGVAHRALGEVKNSGRFVFVHRRILTGCAVERKPRATPLCFSGERDRAGPIFFVCD
jgi:hypothetical protein